MKKRKSSVPSSKSKKSTHAAEPDRANRADRLIDRAILAIQRKSSKLLNKRRLDDEAKYVQLLETIYKTARALENDPLVDVAESLADRVGADVSRKLFAHLIKAALPEVPKPIRKTWVGVLNYADEASIRPEKLADFIALKGGSVKCGDTPPRQRRKEIARWKRDRDKRPSRRIEV